MSIEATKQSAIIEAAGTSQNRIWSIAFIRIKRLNESLKILI